MINFPQRNWTDYGGKVRATADSRNTASQGLIELLGFKKTRELVLSRRVKYLYWKEY